MSKSQHSAQIRKLIEKTRGFYTKDVARIIAAAPGWRVITKTEAEGNDAEFLASHAIAAWLSDERGIAPLIYDSAHALIIVHSVCDVVAIVAPGQSEPIADLPDEFLDLPAEPAET